MVDEVNCYEEYIPTSYFYTSRSYDIVLYIF